MFRLVFAYTVQMDTQKLEWQVECDRETFDKCVADEKFAHIVALARAVNALRFVHSAMLHSGTGDSPEARCGRLNSYLFGSAIMYECMKLLKAMNKPFVDDPAFQNGLRLFLKDKTAQAIERDHLDPARNWAVFHFLPDRFALVLKATTSEGCLFVEGRGNRREDLYYSFADVVAAKIVAGIAEETEEFFAVLGEAMASTRGLVDRFTDQAEQLISHHLTQWGFKVCGAERLRL
jgi:hypothetical protein